MADKILDIAIIGAGPAGLTAGIFAQRAGLSCKIFEKLPLSGGQITNTGEVENYPGFKSIGGFELAQGFYNHALFSGAEIENIGVEKITKERECFALNTDSGKALTRTVIAASGALPKQLGIKGEAEFKGRGVSYCAHCDGAFYRGKAVAVIGGGDTAACEALYLARLCKKVCVIHRRQEFRAAGSLVKRLEKCENIELLTPYTVTEIKGEQMVGSLILENVLDKTKRTIAADGVFIAAGTQPQSAIFKDLAETDESGFLVAGEDCKTTQLGLFAAGDLRTKPLRQIVTAVSDGANAVISAEAYLRSLK